MFGSDLGSAPRCRFTEFPGYIGGAIPGSPVKCGTQTDPGFIQILKHVLCERLQSSSLQNQQQFLFGQFLVNISQTWFLCLSACSWIFPLLTNNCLCAVLSSLAFITPPPPLCLSFPGVADLSLIYKLNNSSFVGVKLCVYAYVCPCQRSPRGSWVRGVNSSFLEVKMQLRQIYCLCPKGGS